MHIAGAAKSVLLQTISRDVFFMETMSGVASLSKDHIHILCVLYHVLFVDLTTNAHCILIPVLHIVHAINTPSCLVCNTPMSRIDIHVFIFHHDMIDLQSQIM